MTDNTENTTNPFAEKEAARASEQEETKQGEEENDLKKELDDINNKYLRLAADFDNYRKRHMQERENLIKYGAEETLKKIIPVLDTFSRAEESVQKLEDTAAVKEGYAVCTKQLNDVLRKIGLNKIEAEGKEFDPSIMDAVMQTPTNDFEPNSVIKEMQAGYRLHDRVLRPALVDVAVEKEEDNGEDKKD